MKKNYLLYLAFCSSLLVFSCNKDDEPKVDSVVGKWDMKNLEIEILNNEAAADTLNGTYSPFQVFLASRVILEIKQDKTFEQILIGLDGATEDFDGEWERKDNTLTMSFDDGDETVYNVISVDAENLVISSSDKLQLPDPNFPDDENKFVEVDATLTLNYEK